MFEVKRYTPEMKSSWNDFVKNSKQGTFLFHRDYMDYHADRFTDFSLVITQKGHIYALLPANRVNDTLYSHQGLTYGGLLTDKRATTAHVCEIFSSINQYLRSEGIRKVVYKAIPWIYHQLPGEEDLYAIITICHAQLTVRHIASTICMQQQLSFKESRKSGVRKAKMHHLIPKISTDYQAFWDILNANLEHKYGAKPVHTPEELQLLASRFPKQIKLYMTFQNETPLGGTLVFETPQVVHTQYISATPEGKKLGALDILFDHLIHDVYQDVTYFDFGKSSDGDGNDLNAPLIFQKEGFGGRGVCYDWYEWTL